MSTTYRWVVKITCFFLRLLLSLRYRISVEGFKEVLSLKKGSQGILFLPNHPAEIDPILLMAYLGPHFYPRGVIVEHFYHLKGFKALLNFARVLPIPSMDEKANRWRKKEVEKVLKEIQKGLVGGDNFLIYPAGRLKKSGLESIGGSSLVFSLVENNKNIPLVLVRTTGLWGSSFSTCATGKSPDFSKTLWHSCKVLLQNAIFFAPRRKVTLSFLVNPPIAKEVDRLVFNRSLESWYNRYPEIGPEVEVHTPYSWWENSPSLTHERPSCDKKKEEDIFLTKEIMADVFSQLSLLSKIPQEEIFQTNSLSQDLGLDSLDIAEIYVFLDRNYNAARIPLEELKTVRDVFKAIQGDECSYQPQTRVEEKQAPSSWLKKGPRRSLELPRGDTLLEAFLYTADRMGSCIACADALSGVFSYRKMKRSILVLAREFSALPGEKIAVLLPSSVTVYLVVIALWLAGKVPVLLNWTAGARALDCAFEVGGFTQTLTSRRFLDRIHLLSLGNIEDTFVLLDDIREKITFKKKMKGVFLSLFSASKILSFFSVKQEASHPAVILFTSGSESFPKAVPLSHQNILSNARDVFSYAHLKEDESLYGVLPPFHSFGFSLTGIIPLLYGMKVFYAPDPTDGRGMANDIQKWQLQILCLAPTFLANLFSLASLEQLSTIRLVVSGAEKPKASIPLFVKTHLPKAEWLEGYGITECSPVVSLTVRGEKTQEGVGKPLKSLSLCFIDPETLNSVPIGSQGEICISGPSVFDGYIGNSIDPFLYRDGKKWYRSGDLGFLDDSGCLHLIDRLKRTVKIGGEMFSLSSVEQELAYLAETNSWNLPDQEGPLFALIATGEEKKELILFTVCSLSLEEINTALRNAHASRLIKISQVKHVSAIPLLGTGKINYRDLSSMQFLSSSP